MGRSFRFEIYWLPAIGLFPSDFGFKIRGFVSATAERVYLFLVICFLMLLWGYQGRMLILSGPGNAAGTFCVTLPVATHSAPLCK